MLMYFGLEFTNYLLTRQITGMHSLYISLACLIASVAGLSYMSDPTNIVLTITLIGWLIIILIIKLIRIEDLPTDRYEYIENAYCLKGARHTFKLGDKIKIKVLRADILAREVDFMYIDN